ncbi:MAG: hypothetical protein RLZ14_404 [Actinomycetota bacterium]
MARPLTVVAATLVTFCASATAIAVPMAAADDTVPPTPTYTCPIPGETPPEAFPAPTGEPPEPIAPVNSPARPGEGQWTQRMALRDVPVLWTTSFRPILFRRATVASIAVFDQTKLRAALYNGVFLPGGGPWKNYKKVSGAAVPALVAAFNGGFQFRHIRGGYMTEGKVRKALANKQATLAIKPDGSMFIGVMGCDIQNDGSWMSLRQNLPPLVWRGASALHLAPRNTYWGDNFGAKTSSRRSAVCTRTDGRMMYVYAGNVTVREFVRVLVRVKCQTAMHLDMNGTWAQFAYFHGGLGTMERRGRTIDSRQWPWYRYLTRSLNDFVALFDPELLPADAVA